MAFYCWNVVTWAGMCLDCVRKQLFCEDTNVSLLIDYVLRASPLHPAPKMMDACARDPPAWATDMAFYCWNVVSWAGMSLDCAREQLFCEDTNVSVLSDYVLRDAHTNYW